MRKSSSFFIIIFALGLITSIPTIFKPITSQKVTSPSIAGNPGPYFGPGAYEKGMFWEYDYTNISAYGASFWGVDQYREGNHTLFEVTNVTTEDMDSHSNPPDWVFTGTYDILKGFVYERNDSMEWKLHPDHQGPIDEEQYLGIRNSTDLFGNWSWWIFPGKDADFSGGFGDKLVSGDPVNAFEVRVWGPNWAWLYDADNTTDILELNFTADTLALANFTHWNGTSIAFNVELCRAGNQNQMHWDVPQGSVIEWDIKLGTSLEIDPGIPSEAAGNKTRFKLMAEKFYQNPSGGWYQQSKWDQAITNGSYGWAMGDSQTEIHKPNLNTSFSVSQDMLFPFEGIPYFIPVSSATDDVDMAWLNRTLSNFLTYAGAGSLYILRNFDQGKRELHWEHVSDNHYLITYNDRGVMTNYTIINGTTTVVQILLNTTFWGKQVWCNPTPTSVCYLREVVPNSETYNEAGSWTKHTIEGFYAGDHGETIEYNYWSQSIDTPLWMNTSRAYYNKTSYLIMPQYTEEESTYLAFNDLLDVAWANGPMLYLPCRDNEGTVTKDLDWMERAFTNLLETMPLYKEPHVSVTGDLILSRTDTAEYVEYRSANASGHYSFVRYRLSDGVLLMYEEGNSTAVTSREVLVDCTHPALAWGVAKDDFFRVEVNGFNPDNEYLFGADDMEGVETGGIIEITVGDLLGEGDYTIGDRTGTNDYDIALRATVDLISGTSGAIETVMSNDILLGAHTLDHRLDFGGGPGPLILPVWKGEGLAKNWFENLVGLVEGDGAPKTLFNKWNWTGNVFRMWNTSNSAEYYIRVNQTNGLFEKVYIKNAQGKTFLNFTRIYYLPTVRFDIDQSWMDPDASTRVRFEMDGDRKASLSDTQSGITMTVEVKLSGALTLRFGFWKDNPSDDDLEITDRDGNEVAVFFVVEGEGNYEEALIYPVIVTITLPAGLPDLTESRLEDRLRIMRWDEDRETWNHDGAGLNVDLSSNTATIWIHHISVFALAYEEDDDRRGWDIPGYQVGTLFVAILGALWILRKKHGRN